MAEYFALRIKSGKLDYDEVVGKYPQYKIEIDNIIEKEEK